MSADPVTAAFAAALYADGERELDTGAALLAADAAHLVEAERRGADFVRRAWERGWQPADVVRVVRRELGERQVAPAARLIADETRRYGERLPPRWDAQLLEVRESAREARTADRFLHATALIELYRLLLRLPAIEAIGPVPGSDGSVPPQHSRQRNARPDRTEPRILVRIRALLAKAERTEFPQEAEALTGKAQELMARHSIDEAVLAHQAEAQDGPAACRVGVDAPYETAKAILLDAVAAANRCRAVWNEAFGFATVVGFEPDLESVELLYTSLLVQGTSAMTKAEAAQRAGGRKRTKTFRQSFLMAYAQRIGHRLTVTADRTTAETAGEPLLADELLPVLAARDVAVTARTTEMFPDTTSTRVRGATDVAGWHHGTAAADRATGL